MSYFLLTVVFSVLPSESSAAADAPVTRAFHEISRDIHDLMQRESLAKSDADRIQAIHELAELYLEIKRDPRLDEAPTLQQYKAKVWTRLIKIKKELQQQIAREKSKATRGQNPALVAARQAELDDARRASESLAAQLSLVSFSMGGPGKLFAAAGPGAFGGAAMADNGEALVELITRVIEPDFWDVNGGPGTIFYYQPLMALVVRATSEVHHKIGGALGGLR